MKGFLLALVCLFPVSLGGLVLVGGGDGEYEGHASIQVERRAAHVFDWVTAPEKRVDWIQALLESKAESSASGALELGDRFQQTYRVPEGRESRTLEVTALIPGESVSYRTTREGQPFEITFSLSNPYSANRTVVSVDYRATWAETWQKLGEPVLSSKLQGQIQEDLERMKAMCEGAPESF